MQGDYGGMADLTDDAGFTEKTLACFALRQAGRKELDSHMAADQRVEAAGDSAIRAGADGVLNLVTPNFHRHPSETAEVRDSVEIIGICCAQRNDTNVQVQGVQRY